VQLKLDGTRAETRFHLSAKQTSACDLGGATAQSNTDSRGVRASCQHFYCTGKAILRGLPRHAGYPLHSPVVPLISPSIVTMCRVILITVYHTTPYHHTEHNKINLSCHKMSNLTLYVPSHHSTQTLTLDSTLPAPQQIAYLLYIYSQYYPHAAPDLYLFTNHETFSQTRQFIYSVYLNNTSWTNGPSSGWQEWNIKYSFGWNSNANLMMAHWAKPCCWGNYE
jgi:hypothetical protein